MLDIQLVVVARARLNCHVHFRHSIELDVCDNMRFVHRFCALVVLAAAAPMNTSSKPVSPTNARDFEHRNEIPLATKRLSNVLELEAMALKPRTANGLALQNKFRTGRES